MIHAHIKKKPANTNPNWQTPAKVRPAFNEPNPDSEKFSMTHAHARSRLNGRSGEEAMGGQLK